MIGQYSYTKGIEAAIRAGFDTDTVAAIAGSLLGALSGALYLPEEWKDILHGWPGSTSQDLVNLTVQTLEVRP
jgi:ADP-ribosylglycohydrolase